MAQNTHGETARIYAFPVSRVRPASSVAAERSSVVSLAARRAAGEAAVCGGSWYHEAAIRDEATDRKQ